MKVASAYKCISTIQLCWCNHENTEIEQIVYIQKLNNGTWKVRKKRKGREREREREK